ncbi:hypothetical protein [Roseateles noduli]|uniref:hypothetical protein n=1 Tax=Roseateles noduli TaxID=2052484 RepID=UPI003D648795
MSASTPSIHIALSRPPSARERRRYVHEDSGWLFTPVRREDPAWTSTARCALPERLHALAPTVDGPVPNWRARVAWRDERGEVTGSDGQAALTITGMAGPTRRERGASIDIEHPGTAAALLPPGIAAEAPKQFARLALGWNTGTDATAPVPPRAESWLITLPEEQRLLVWARAAREDEAATTDTRVRVESDGRVLDPGAWRDSFEALDRQTAEALDRLRQAWRSAEAVSSTGLAGRPALLAAEAGVAWGYREGASLDLAPTMHMTGALRGCLCRWALSWHGLVDIDGARARVRLDVVDDPALMAFRREWDCAWSPSSDPTTLPWAPWRLPLRLTMDTVASTSASLIADIDWASEPPAIVGGVGLRPSSRGNGLEWAFVAALEPVAVRVGLSEPWTGRRERTLDWLPALPLVDWRCDA